MLNLKINIFRINQRRALTNNVNKVISKVAITLRISDPYTFIYSKVVILQSPKKVSFKQLSFQVNKWNNFKSDHCLK